MINKISFAICFCIISFVCFGQTKPDFIDKYEYDVWESPVYSWYSFPPAIASQPSVYQQLKVALNNKGSEGWEIDKIEKFEFKSQVQQSGITQTETRTLSVLVILRRKIYDTQTEIEKKVEFYTKKYADSIRIEMQTLINSNTWAALGKNYKQEIVNEILKPISVMFNEAVKKIIDNSKK